MDRINATTFGREVKSNPKDRIQVEVGDSKQPDFKPQVKLMRWDNEVNLSIRAEEHPDATVETGGGVIKYITPDYEVHQYDKPEAGEDGGFEFEWILKKKPDTNILSATLQTKGLNFFYQPPLTQEEIDEGVVRPENVIGSYAVYHKTKGGMNRSDGMEYKTGKAFHIYRPQAFDANGLQTWCDLNIDEQKGELTVTVPQTFLNNAAYPVRVDPTFGYTSIGATGVDATNDIEATQFAAPEAGTVQMLTAYVDDNTVGSISMKAGIYNSDNSFLSETVELTDVTNLEWRDFDFAVDPSISNATYWLVVYGENASQPSIRMDTDATVVGGSQSEAGYPTFPATLVPGTDNDRRHSIYATYTADDVSPHWNIAYI